MRKSLVLAVSLLFAGVSSARAADFVLPDPATGDAHQCHNPHTGGGGYQIDWDGLGFDSGNPHGTLHISGASNVNITMSTQFAELGTLVKPATGNTLQTTNTLVFGSGEGATFNFGNVTGLLLENNEPIDFKGTHVNLLQSFTLTIFTTTGSYVFDMESIMGSEINFDHNGNLRSVNLRFCAELVGGPTPPPVPEPASLFAIGLAGLGLVRTARRKLAV